MSTLLKLAPVWLFVLRIAEELFRLNTSTRPSSFPNDLGSVNAFANRRSTSVTVHGQTGSREVSHTYPPLTEPMNGDLDQEMWLIYGGRRRVSKQ